MKQLKQTRLSIKKEPHITRIYDSPRTMPFLITQAFSIYHSYLIFQPTFSTFPMLAIFTRCNYFNHSDAAAGNALFSYLQFKTNPILKNPDNAGAKLYPLKTTNGAASCLPLKLARNLPHS